MSDYKMSEEIEGLIYEKFIDFPNITLLYINMVDSILEAILYQMRSEYTNILRYVRFILSKHFPDRTDTDYVEMIKVERQRQEVLHKNKGYTVFDYKLIMLEEYGEMIKEYNNQNWKAFEVEAVQLMAVVVRYIESVGCEKVEASDG